MKASMVMGTSAAASKLAEDDHLAQRERLGDHHLPAHHKVNHHHADVDQRLAVGRKMAMR
jgi:hypothetical protein